VDRADVADDDKAMACVNLATVCDRSNDVDQALAWYDQALAFANERRRLVEEKRATYLASKARFTEAIDVLTRLLQAPNLEPGDRLRLEHNLAEAQCGRYSPPVNGAGHELFFRGAAAFEAGDDAAATAAFRQIVDRADVADDDKAMACVNLATVCDRSNDVDQALIWYDRALSFAVGRRRFVEESRAIYLVSKARFTEAIDILTRVLQARDLEPADRHRLEHNLAEARRQLRR
jgi:tetratricopeptide (TPR) repeat protein